MAVLLGRAGAPAHLFNSILFYHDKTACLDIPTAVDNSCIAEDDAHSRLLSFTRYLSMGSGLSFVSIHLLFSLNDLGKSSEVVDHQVPGLPFSSLNQGFVNLLAVLQIVFRIFEGQRDLGEDLFEHLAQGFHHHADQPIVTGVTDQAMKFDGLGRAGLASAYTLIDFVDEGPDGFQVLFRPPFDGQGGQGGFKGLPEIYQFLRSDQSNAKVVDHPLAHLIRSGVGNKTAPMDPPSR